MSPTVLMDNHDGRMISQRLKKHGAEVWVGGIDERRTVRVLRVPGDGRSNGIVKDGV